MIGKGRKHMPVLRGKKVMLRPYRRDDIKGILSWVNNAETVRYLSSWADAPYTEKNAEQYLDYAMTGGSDRMMFVMADAVTEEYCGQISLECINHRNGTAELRIVIGAAEQRAKGLGGEAIRMLLHYAFETLGLRRIELDVYADNSAARLCYLKAGFKEEGVKRQHVWKNGAYRDIVFMAVLRDEYEEAHHD